MTINPQFQGHDQFDILMGSVTSHFTTIDSVLLKNECVNGGYNVRTSASYAQNCPVATPGFTRVCISSNGTNVTDLENSYITAELEVTLEPSNDVGFTFNGDMGCIGTSTIGYYFVGFKQSLDALSRYSIYVNSQHLYTQNFVGQESFVQYAGLNDTMLKNNPYVYTSYENASRLSPNVCGTYVMLTDTDPVTIKIPIKINLHQILLLSPLKYLPSFCGKWEIELYFSAQNLVYCPVDPTVYIRSNTVPTLTSYIGNELSKYSGTFDADTDYKIKGERKGYSNYFTQIGNPAYAITKNATNFNNCNKTQFDAAAGKPILDFIPFTLNQSNCVVRTCLSNITHFQLKYEVFAALMKHYTDHPLVVPCNILQYQRFIQNSNGNDVSIQSSANLSFENLDSLFILIPNSPTCTTCYYQPYLSACRVTLGEFGVRPQQYVSTFNDPRFIGLTLDALNLESSQISAMNKDFSNSILTVFPDGQGDAICTSDFQRKYDKSSFMIGLSCSQVGFQSGTISSTNNQVNMQFDSRKEDYPDIVVADQGVRFDNSAPLVVMLLLDSALLIQVIPNSDQPVVKLTSKTVV